MAVQVFEENFILDLRCFPLRMNKSYKVEIKTLSPRFEARVLEHDEARRVFTLNLEEVVEERLDQIEGFYDAVHGEHAGFWLLHNCAPDLVSVRFEGEFSYLFMGEDCDEKIGEVGQLVMVEIDDETFARPAIPNFVRNEIAYL